MPELSGTACRAAAAVLEEVPAVLFAAAAAAGECACAVTAVGAAAGAYHSHAPVAAAAVAVMLVCGLPAAGPAQPAMQHWPLAGVLKAAGLPGRRVCGTRGIQVTARPSP